MLEKKKNQALETILARASVDRAFREGLLANPRDVIETSLGIRVPEDFRIRFIERDPDLDALVVLPDFRHEGDELSDVELEVASGGVGLDYAW